MLIQKLDIEYRNPHGSKLSTLGTGLFWIKTSYQNLISQFGKETVRNQDHPNTSERHPDEVLWYLQLFDGRVIVIHNQALRNDPPPERCKEWRIGPNNDLTFIGYKILELIMAHDYRGLIEFMFTKYKVEG